MRLNPPQLAGHLARGLAPLYVVAGEEPLLILESLDAIRAAARKAGYSEREVIDADRTFNWQQLADSCASMSLFASKRIVEVRLLASGPGDGASMLKALAESPPPDVLLIVVAGDLDSRTRNGGWYAALENAGASVYAWPVRANEFPDWLAARLRSAGVDAEPEAVRVLAERTEGNLLAAAQDIEKLKLLFPGQRIGVEQLSAAVADSARFEAFDLAGFVLAGDGVGATRSLARLREEGAAVLEILGALSWTLRVLAKAAVAMSRIKDAQAACQQSGVRPQQVAAYSTALRRVRWSDALDWVGRGAGIDALVKSGGEAQAWEELLTLILAASGAARKRTSS